MVSLCDIAFARIFQNHWTQSRAQDVKGGGGRDKIPNFSRLIKATPIEGDLVHPPIKSSEVIY